MSYFVSPSHLYEPRPSNKMATRRTMLRLTLLFLTAAAVYAGNKAEGGGIQVEDFLSRAQNLGIISYEQLTKLQRLASSLEVGEIFAPAPPQDEGLEEPEKQSVFMRMYNQLTLLNVLYFSGALLIMGAYTLFMTLAWELCGGEGIAVVMTFQVILSGIIGLMLWLFNEEFQFLGGLLCSVSTSMVPFAVYGMQRAMKIWPKEDPGPFQGFRNYVRSGFVVMEIATILVGLGYLQVVHFPFLLAPVSFCLWFLSMDLAPFFPQWNRSWRDLWEVRRQLSLAFGLGMLLAGWVMERLMGSEPDFGFWLYLFGLISFWFAMTFDFPEYDLHGSIYLLINVCLGLVGSHLNRITFYVFGTLGVIVYVAGIYSNRIKSTNSTALWLLKALAAAALFAQAIRRDGNIEILGALVCLLAFNFNAIHFLGSGEHYYLFLLATNLGFVACSGSFQRPLPLWLFTLGDAQLPVSLVCSLTVAIFHVGLLKYTLGGGTQASSTSRQQLNTVRVYLYHAYRLVASMLVSLAFVFVRQPGFAWIGGLGIPLVAANFSPVLRKMVRDTMSSHSHGAHSREPHTANNIIQYLVLLLGIAFSNYIQSNILYLICCLSMLVAVISFLDKWKVGGCILSIGLILLAVPLQSKFMIAIGAIYIFAYLSYLAYEVFKNSLLFPLALIAIGVLIIYCGITYQRSEALIKEAYDSIIPDNDPIKLLLTQSIYTHWQPMSRLDWYHYLKQTEFSKDNFFQMPLNWLAWSAALVHALAKGAAPYITILCAGGITILIAVAVLAKFRNSLIKDLDDLVVVTRLTFSLSRDHDSHGIIVKAEGRKPVDLEQPAYIALDVLGQEFWGVVARAFGEWKSGLARSMFLPYTLTPHLISFSGFAKGKNVFSAKVLLATGHKGSQRGSHTTIRNTLEKLRRIDSSAEVECALMYSNAWYMPYSKLCQKSVTLNDIGRGLDKQ